MTEPFSDLTNVMEIPCLEADKQNTRDLGVFITKEEFKHTPLTYVEMIDWNTKRSLIIPQEEEESEIKIYQKDSYCFSKDKDYRVKVDDEDMYIFYFHKAFYHPDSSHIIVPKENSPYILILGTQPYKLRAYIFDGSCGFDIAPGIWHQHPILHYEGDLTFMSKQATSHICVEYDSVKEDNRYLSFSYV